MSTLRRWFLKHWFFGVFAIIGGIWLATTMAYLLGAKSITFGNRYGSDATIDFGREHDYPVVRLGKDVGLELNRSVPSLHGSIVNLKPGLPVLCWVCGATDKHGGVAMVDYRQGDWFYRAPFDNSKNGEAHTGRPASREFILTIAYNRVTRERVMVGADASLPEQEQALTSRGLGLTDASKLSAATLKDLPDVSMMREGCLVVQLAFVAVALLWLVVGGLIALLTRLVRGRKGSQAAGQTP